MSEAEDVITDAARHATETAQRLWRRHRAARGDAPPPRLALADIAPRLDLLLVAVFGRGFALRIAQPPLAPTLLSRLFAPHRGAPPQRDALPATDGMALWLPRQASVDDPALAAQQYRLAALRQAMRAVRNAADALPRNAPPLVRDLYLLLEADAADGDLLALLPGLRGPLAALRRDALARRPALPPTLTAPLRDVEALAQRLLAAAPDEAPPPAALLAQEARRMAEGMGRIAAGGPHRSPAKAGASLLFKDAWTGELHFPPVVADDAAAADDTSAPADDDAPPPRSARLPRSPRLREGQDDEDDRGPGASMVQPSAPHEQAADPHGLQRPTDRRDTPGAADEYADALSELPELRLVSAPGTPKEVLLSDDPPERRSPPLRHRPGAADDAAPRRLAYPEWDWRARAYRQPGAIVHLLDAEPGPQRWVDDTLAAHRLSLGEIARRFELLRPTRLRLRRQPDGDEIDIDACIEHRADIRAGHGASSQALYQTDRRARRDLAVLLLADTSGSTDGWAAAHRRVIDIEREALLLVCVALHGLGAPYAVQAFSGDGPQRVTVRGLKRFDEPYGDEIARRIAGLEPERYTRAGAALRHASALLARRPAAHRLLVLLSDGKPNDVDDYGGRYGVEDLRQAVAEARLQGISPFCLTVDRQAAGWLAHVFGAGHYTLLTQPARLPAALLDWMRRLLAA